MLQIVHRYDIILIQEVRDSDLSATKKLMEHVNKLDTLCKTHILYKHILQKTNSIVIDIFYRDNS